MSIQDAARAALAVFPPVTIHTAGGDYPLPVVMVAIAGGESGWRNDAQGDFGLTDRPSCRGYTSFGMWQINSIHYTYLTGATGSNDPCVWAEWLYDPANNAQAAQAILGYEPEKRLSAWTVWKTGAYARYLDQAKEAVEALSITPGPVEQPLFMVLFTWQAAAAAAMLLGGSVLIGMALTQRRRKG